MSSGAFRWGVLSTGKICADFANAIRQLEGHQVSAVISRTRANAEKFAGAHCPKGAIALTGLDELETGMVDAVYVGSPNDSHFKDVKALLEKRQPVLCEKSLTTSMEETDALVQLAKDKSTFLMEGMWTRCFPATIKARELINQGAIGDIVKVQAEFGYDIENGCPASVRGNAKTGGMTMDIGIYLIEKALLAYPSSHYECINTSAVSINGITDGVDLSVSASVAFRAKSLDFQNFHERQHGGVASLAWTGLADTPETCSIIGTRGAIIFDTTAHIPPTFLLRQRVSRTEMRETRFDFPPPPDDKKHNWNYPSSICLQYEALAVERALRSNLTQAPEWTLDDSVVAHTILHRLKVYLDSSSNFIID
uniref:D-xylose 1-dehydrogenase (NADP(+), D-xylono-1,5-lactone-forming) n=1 Tax=Aureoumbra lagunensis TaxID=44058 RepID=A0A7S3K0M8_9STRA|mmetsp:Transcript_23468/g.30488  ORF Transcript_23468/g.30488 Transcript_23468/m.30488 type:complete len:366 (+) Transcript_23468:18-1115(+)